MAGFAFEKKPEAFPPLYLEEPERYTASCNAGDYRLYLGGGSINGAFGDLLACKQGLEMKNDFLPSRKPVQMEYMELHQLLLKVSREQDGQLVAASELSGKHPEVIGLLEQVHLTDSFCVSGEAHGEEDARYAQAVGSAFLDVYTELSRPLNARNVAMLYVVGPKDQGSSGGGGPMLTKVEFLRSLTRLGEAAVKLVVDYNAKYVAAAPNEGRLPRVEEIRWCLVSGGKYKHHDATKEQVARATLEGMNAVKDKDKPLTTFTYDEDVFRLASEDVEA